MSFSVAVRANRSGSASKAWRRSYGPNTGPKLRSTWISLP